MNWISIIIIVSGLLFSFLGLNKIYKKHSIKSIPQKSKHRTTMAKEPAYNFCSTGSVTAKDNLCIPILTVNNQYLTINNQ